MNIIDKNRKLNELIKNGYVNEYLGAGGCSMYLSGKNIFCNDSKYSTLDKEMDCLSSLSRVARFLNNVLIPAGIIDFEIETGFDVILDYLRWQYMFLRKDNGTYTFVECDIDNTNGEEVNIANVYKFDLNNEMISYDSIDFIEKDYRHDEARIDSLTLSRINHWSTYFSYNSLYYINAYHYLQKNRKEAVLKGNIERLTYSLDTDVKITMINDNLSNNSGGLPEFQKREQELYEETRKSLMKEFGFK